ncbi:Gfo/Idh/MocA family protein [Cohaesibacter gelatinilyticus]|uniref:Predicted dehydrogenase n=1 Tax=Cohaesibacter gelatinilyticus TaxID=372072 RepID=A0A285PEK0_9HYPH|nr:Gfo/Idh/MocA family oxidoreductase [Cohaesibacter gelatinilyticus]SNZ20145.1 Predicted dehydrogenase [Cohaesibacter gelatinilyticus]
MFSAAVIGYKNHAKRVIDCLVNQLGIQQVTVYHPNNDKVSQLQNQVTEAIRYSSNWDDVLDCDAIFICSPSGTHVSYIQKILKTSQGGGELPYIYCEKPPGVTKTELFWLEDSKPVLCDRLYFGFNYRFSPLLQQLKKIVQSGELGSPICANFNISHGLAFKPGMGSNWRFCDPSVFSKVSGNLGIHYVDMCLECFGPLEKHTLYERNIAGNTQADTAVIQLVFKSGMVCNIMLTYASVFTKDVDVFFSDGIFQAENSEISIYSPRDTFNSRNEFCKPKAHTVNMHSGGLYQASGLYDSLDHFVQVVQNKATFDLVQYEQSLTVTRVFLA